MPAVGMEAGFHTSLVNIQDHVKNPQLHSLPDENYPLVEKDSSSISITL